MLRIFSINVFMYVCIYIYVYICTYIYIWCVCVCVCICIYICMYVLNTYRRRCSLVGYRKSQNWPPREANTVEPITRILEKGTQNPSSSLQYLKTFRKFLKIPYTRKIQKQQPTTTITQDTTWQEIFTNSIKGSKCPCRTYLMRKILRCWKDII